MVKRIDDRHTAPCSKCGALGEMLFIPNKFSINPPGDWTVGVWEDLDINPIYIKDRKHLVNEMKKRKLFNPMLIKHKSQGAGYEFKK